MNKEKEQECFVSIDPQDELPEIGEEVAILTPTGKKFATFTDRGFEYTTDYGARITHNVILWMRIRFYQ